MTEQAVDHTSLRKSVSLLQEQEFFPRHRAGAASPRQPAFPDLPRSLQKFLEAVEVASDSVVAVVALQLLLQRLVLNRDRLMPVVPTPLR